MQGWGKTIVLGVQKPRSQMSLSSFEVLHTGKTLTGALFGGVKTKSDLPLLLKRYTDNVNSLNIYELVFLERFESIAGSDAMHICNAGVAGRRICDS